MGLGGPSRGQSLVDWVGEKSVPSLVGGGLEMPETLLDTLLANIGQNLLKNGSFESWSSGTTSAPDGWTLTGAGATIALNATDVRHGSASCDVTAALNTATDLAQSITISATKNTRLRGRWVTFIAEVKVSTAARVFLKLDDGVGTAESVKHPGDGTFRELVVSLEIDASATKIEASLEISSGASITATVDAARLTEGQNTAAYSLHSSDLLLRPRIVSATANFTTTSASFVAITTMSIANVIVDGEQSVQLLFVSRAHHSDVAASFDVAVFRGSTQLPAAAAMAQTVDDIADAVDYSVPIVMLLLDPKPAAGNYTYEVRARTSAATLTLDDRSFSVLVFPDL